MEKKKHYQRKIIIVMGAIIALLIAGGIVGQALINKNNSTLIFKDLPPSHWAYDTVMWAIDLGITTGYPDGTFQPQKPVTEAELLAMLFRTFEEEQEVQEDAEIIGDWASRYYIKAIEKNWNVWGRASRNQVLSRVDMAIIVTSALGYNLSEDGAIQTILDLGISQGKSSSTIEGFGFGALTRAEAVQTMKNIVELGIIELKARPIIPSPQPLLNSEFNKFVSPIQKLVIDSGYSFKPTAWSREAKIRHENQGIIYLTYHSDSSPYNQLILYAAEEKRHRELVQDIFKKIGIPIQPGLEQLILRARSESVTIIEEYGKWMLTVTPGNLPSYVQISFWRVK